MVWWELRTHDPDPQTSDPNRYISMRSRYLCSGRAEVVALKPTSVKRRTPRGQTQASNGQGRKVLFFGSNLLLQLPSTYTFFTKALGLSNEEVHSLLLPIYTEKIDHKIGAQMIDDARERRYIFCLALFLQICKIMSGGVPCGPPWYQIQDRWCLPWFERGGLSILFLIILLRLVIPPWMTSSPSSKRRNLMLFRFPLMFLTSLPERLIFVHSKTCGHASWALRPTLKMVCFEFLTLSS